MSPLWFLPIAVIVVAARGSMIVLKRLERELDSLRQAQVDLKLVGVRLAGMRDETLSSALVRRGSRIIEPERRSRSPSP